jgi:hypothetical protein
MSCIPYAFTELSKRELTIVVSLSPYEKLLQISVPETLSTAAYYIRIHKYVA